jgi:uncharacterized damage-inducible protein DinB
LVLYQRNAWANREVLGACADLGPSILLRDAQGTYGALASTLHHIVRGEQDYLQRLTGDDPSEWVLPERPIGLDRLAALAEEGDQRLCAVLATAPDPQRMVWEEWEGQREGVAAWVILVQLVHHGDDHRAHVGTIMGAAGEDLSAAAHIESGPTPPAGLTAGAWADALLLRFFEHSSWRRRRCWSTAWQWATRCSRRPHAAPTAPCARR